MELGIFAKTFARPNLEDIWDAVASYGFSCVQFNFSCAGLPTLPQRIDSTITDRIRREMSARGIKMSAVSGTFNMIHPDRTKRRFGLERLHTLASACDRLNTQMISLCTGTRDPFDMWRFHPENSTASAWNDLVEAMGAATRIAGKLNLVLGVEPEVGNVVDSAAKARKLLDELRSPHVKIIIDPANLFHEGELGQMKKILNDAFQLLGDDIVMAHAKDLRSDGKAGDLPAGQGVLDYDTYLNLLDRCGFRGPLILHGLTESQVPTSLDFVKSKLPRQQRFL